MFIYYKCNFQLFESNNDEKMTLVCEIHVAVQCCLQFWGNVANKIILLENIYSLSEKRCFLFSKLF